MNHENNTIKNIIINTYKNARHTIFFMLKITVPTTFIVILLKYLGFIKYIAMVFKPLMTIFGIRGEAALVIITGNLVNIYGAVAAMATLTFTVKEVTIISIILLFSHSLIIESAVIRSLKVPIYKQLLVRIGTAVFSGILLNLLIGNNYQEIAYKTKINTENIPKINPFFPWIKDLLSTYFHTILNTAIQLIIIITAILLGLEILKELKILDKLNSLVYRLTKHLGVTKPANFSLLVGFLIGITYGASAILVNYKEGSMNKKDVALVTTFLLLCHAIIEDMLIFISKGAVPWIIILYRVGFTIIIIYLYNFLLYATEKRTKNFL